MIITLILTILLQMVNPVHWTAVEHGDSVTLTATMDEGFHMGVFAINDMDVDDDNEYSEYTITLAKAEASIRYNACNDMMCTAPETYRYARSGESREGRESIEGRESREGKESIESTEGTDLLHLLLMGLLGGLLAIFTPCVWPIIPMTVSFFLKRTDNGIRSALIYGIGIIVIYVGLGLLVTILFGASALNAMSTNAVVNIIFFLVLVAFALSFFGLFEITLPSSWSTAMDSKARSTGGVLGILFMAFTLVIVSFSCTGPIIGTLLVEAAGHSLLAPTVGMFGFALALALPFSLFALFPKMLQSVPRSGGWMQDFKVTLAFLELALSLKFLSVADLAYGWGILPRWLFVLLWTLCFAGIAVYLAVRLLREKCTTTRRTISIAVILASAAFSCYLVPGIFGAPVKAIAAFTPPLPIEGQEVFHDYEQGMAYARQEGKPVLIDFTGYGCVNCRKMEAYVIADATVQERLKNYVFIELYVDDKNDGIGERNSALEREIIGANSQPYYIQMTPTGEKVGEPIAFTTDPQQFIHWLKY